MCQFVRSKVNKQSENGIYHIVLRGSNRQTIFEDEEDAIKLLETLQRHKPKPIKRVTA
jgi:putative transposase